MITDEIQPFSKRFDKVIVCSGHMIDAPKRETPRFPASKANAVRAEIARQLDCWNTGPNDLAICGGASGADILFAEECLQRGAKLRLLLAQKKDEFVRESVEPAGPEWMRRFRALRNKADLAILSAAPADGGDLSIYERNNVWILETALCEAVEPASIHALLVWDEQPTGDGPGGTSDFVKKVRDLGGVIAIINPTKLP
jgi:hypothetical protein